MLHLSLNFLFCSFLYRAVLSDAIINQKRSALHPLNDVSLFGVTFLHIYLYSFIEVFIRNQNKVLLLFKFRFQTQAFKTNIMSHNFYLTGFANQRFCTKAVG